MIMQTVINQTTKQVKRYGYCGFLNDGEFDAPTESIIEKDFIFEPIIKYQDWYWNSATEEFQQTPP